ncbi:MAG: sulfatase-like hydrolase/transferase [Phycisphaerales bacterium]|nr:MAG: sulfatase-like hydrolase/transferase [Phycisphaerales bacterium]
MGLQTRRQFLRAASVAGGSLAMSLLLRRSVRASERTRRARRPNIVFILADDLGYGDLGCYGHTDIKTPVLDGLAAEGVRFTQCYANGPECSPTRTAFMTGRYQQRVGGLECAIGTGNVGRYDDAIRLRETHDLGLPVTETSIARMLKDAGYATAITGKWHLGYEPKFAPHLHGFDRTFYCIGGGMDYFHYLDTVAGYSLFEDGRPIRREGYFTDLATNEAVKFIEDHQDKPFFLYVPYTAPHAPFQGPNDRCPDPLPLDSPLWNQGKAPSDVYLAMIERMDTCIGKILRTLDDTGLTADTLVIFVGDNGGTASARNAPLSRGKGTTFEGGIRVPGIVRWPGYLNAGLVSDQVCITMDFSASIVRIAGAQPPADRPFDGIDVIRLLEEKRPPQRRTLFWRGRRGTRTRWAVRDGNLKYVREHTPAKTSEYLFDLARDIGEQQNLLATRPGDAARLKALLADWERHVRPSR